MKQICKRYRKQLLLIIYGIIMMPVFYSILNNGLDSSWEYALNKLTSFNNIKYGRDILFTYGPLGFLFAPMHVNGCFWISVIIYMFFFVSTMILYQKIIKRLTLSFSLLLISVFILFLGPPTRAADLYMQYCLLLTLTVLWENMDDIFAGVFLIIIVTVIFFFKFSVAIAAIGTFFCFLLSKILMKEYKKIWLLFLPCITIPVFYYLYNPSFHDFLRYIRGGMEISMGFNTAMSLPQNDPYVFWMFFLMGIYVLIMISQLVDKNRNNFFVMLWFAPCLFMSYKHGYVRADGHAMLGYVEIIAMLSIEVLLFDFSSIYSGLLHNKKKDIFSAVLLLLFSTTVILNYDSNIHPWQTLLNKIHSVPMSFDVMTEAKVRKNEEALLGIPDTMLEIIGDDSFTSYPWEITFIEKNEKLSQNYVPLPVLQIYSAYTPYLDIKTANLFKTENAPEYIIFKLDTIDNRFALLEAPATWKAINNCYEYCTYDANGQYFLLKHRKKNIINRTCKTEKVVFNKESVITFDGCSEAKLYVNLTGGGQLIKLLWKIPEVTAEITYTSGAVRNGRVILDNLSNGIIIKGEPYDYDTLLNSLYSDGANCTIQSIKLAGEGLKYYKDSIIVERVFYEKKLE